ncbi:MAG: molybdopterin-dependent oxidoreductase [Bacteroidetes bacterium]|nr:molybdopterin-dependent oxidoreductase [Bacteroidota bacterium]
MTSSFKSIRRFCLASILLFSACSDNSQNQNHSSKDSTADEMVIAPGKQPMRLLTDRPMNLETPLHYFLLDYTPNDVFFVRWHLAVLPDKVDPDTFRLRIDGHVQKPLALSINDLKTKFNPVTITALAQCSGNSRSFFDPRVPGGQWKNGAMGNAKWTGVRLCDLLKAAGLKKEAFDVVFNGLDAALMPETPDFVKSLRLEKALDTTLVVAYEMNGKEIPLLNGYPLKLVVPGWYATYWVGMLSNIHVQPDTFGGFWMKTAYLVPKGVKNGNEKPDSLATEMQPMGKMDVRSIFVTPEPDSILAVGETVEFQGLAMDGGDGIVSVEISADGGKTWKPTQLDAELGKFSWRRWRYKWNPTSEGTFHFKVKATNAVGDTQPEHHWNRSGYMRNEIEELVVKVGK